MASTSARRHTGTRALFATTMWITRRSRAVLTSWQNTAELKLWICIRRQALRIKGLDIRARPRAKPDTSRCRRCCSTSRQKLVTHLAGLPYGNGKHFVDQTLMISLVQAANAR